MNMKDAINLSQIRAARGYDDNGECVVSVANYGGCVRWLSGFGGNWSKDWIPLEDEDYSKLVGLNFKPSGPRPVEQIGDEVLSALRQIREEEDDFEPMGESYQ